MLHLLPADSPADARPAAYAEAVSRLASVRHALRLVSPFGSGPAPDLGDDEPIACAWDDAGAARQRLFDRRATRLVGATAAGVEALMASHVSGHEPHAEASNAMVDEIRRELADIARVVVG